MAASSNPFGSGSRGWGTLVYQNHGAGGGNCSIMVGVFVCLCLVSKKPSEWKFFFPAGTDLGVKLLTLMWVSCLLVRKGMQTPRRRPRQTSTQLRDRDARTSKVEYDDNEGGMEKYKGDTSGATGWTNPLFWSQPFSLVWICHIVRLWWWRMRTTI